MDNAIRIVTWRKARGLTQQALATKAGVTISAVCHWEKGDTSPSQRNLLKVMAALDTTLPLFYGPLPKADRTPRGKRAKKAA